MITIIIISIDSTIFRSFNINFCYFHVVLNSHHYEIKSLLKLLLREKNFERREQESTRRLKNDVPELERECCIRGYHVYQAVWHAAIGETLVCVRMAVRLTCML